MTATRSSKEMLERTDALPALVAGLTEVDGVLGIRVQDPDESE